MKTALDTERVKNWRSVVTVVVFALINLPIIFPFWLPLPVPRPIPKTIVFALSSLRIIPWRKRTSAASSSRLVWYRLPINYVTAPVIAVLFLLAVTAIGTYELATGIIGDDDVGICPYDLILVFLSLGCIANSIGAAGLVRYLVRLALRRYGNKSHRLYFFLYFCFFAIGAFLGNDPIMVLFLAYLCRTSSNIVHPRAWIHTQFSVANIATGILVSSNPTNLVLTGAFNIKFINYAANTVVPVIVTVVLLFPCLLYIIFGHQSLIPLKIQIHKLPDELRNKKPVNANIPFARGRPKTEDEDEETQLQELREAVFLPYLDKTSALVGTTVLMVTVILLLALNAVYLSKGGNTDFWVTLPVAFTMLCWDLAVSWVHRREVRTISRYGREEAEMRQAERGSLPGSMIQSPGRNTSRPTTSAESIFIETKSRTPVRTGTHEAPLPSKSAKEAATTSQVPENAASSAAKAPQQPTIGVQRVLANLGLTARSSIQSDSQVTNDQDTLLQFLERSYEWYQVTFPTTTISLRQLPYDIIPFAFSIFILVEALISKGWIPIFAHGWDKWASKTGPVGGWGSWARCCQM